MYNKKNNRLAFMSFAISLLLWVSLFLNSGTIAQEKQKKYQLNYKSQVGDLYQYEFVENTVSTMEQMERSMEIQNDKKYTYTLLTEKVDSLIHFVLTIDTIGTSIHSDMFNTKMDFGDIQGKRIRVKIYDNGVRSDISSIDSLSSPKVEGVMVPGDSIDPAMLYAPGFASLPDKSFTPGDSWTEENTEDFTEIRDMMLPGESSTESESLITIISIETKHEYTCLYLKKETNYSVTSTNETPYGKSTTEGEGETVEHIWFAFNEGILVEFSSENFFEGTTAISGQMSMTIPMSTLTKTSVRLLKYEPAK